MNSVVLIGRLVRDVDVRYTSGDSAMCIARYTLAVDRRYKKDAQQTADFIPCVAMGRNGEFAEKYFHKGMKVATSGHIQTGSYTNRDGQKVYTTDVIIDSQEFVESKGASQQNQSQPAQTQSAPQNDDFMSVPDGLDNEELPFS